MSWQQYDDMPRVKRMPSIELEADATVGGASVVRMNGHVMRELVTVGQNMKRALS